MRWSRFYRIYRNFAILFHIAVFLMIFLAILPVAIKSTAVENVGEATWSFDGRYVVMDVPVKIKNGGIYDLNDINVKFSVRNSSAVFVDTGQNVGAIPAGKEKTIHIRIPVDMKHIYELEKPNFYHFYNYDTFRLNFSLSLNYMLNFVYFDSTYLSDVRWEPIIKEFKTYHPSFIEQNGSVVRIVIPYTINTASYLKGKAEFSGKVWGLENIGTFTTTFPLGKRYDGNLYLDFNGNATKSLLTKSQDLHLRGNVSFEGFNVPLKTNYHWGAPLNNLHFEVLSNGTLHYSFENDADFSMNLLIQKDYYYNGSLVYHSEERLYVNSGDRVDRYEEPEVSEPVDRIVITISDDDTGILSREVVDL